MIPERIEEGLEIMQYASMGGLIALAVVFGLPILAEWLRKHSACKPEREYRESPPQHFNCRCTGDGMDHNEDATHYLIGRFNEAGMPIGMEAKDRDALIAAGHTIELKVDGSGKIAAFIDGVPAKGGVDLTKSKIVGISMPVPRGCLPAIQAGQKADPPPPLMDVPFSLMCRGDCDAGQGIASKEVALALGWTGIEYDDGPSWNFLGLCPDCKKAEDEAVAKQSVILDESSDVSAFTKPEYRDWIKGLTHREIQEG